MIKRPNLILLLFLFSCSLFSFAQSSDLPRVSGWLDDDNYLETIEKQLYKVNVSTGDKELYAPINYKDEVSQNLPEGFKLDFNSVATENYDHTVLIKDNNLYYYSRETKKLRQLTANQSAEKNPTFSPSNTKVAFTRDHDLYYIDIESGLEHRLTYDATDVIYNGWSSWVYYEEIIGRRSRHRAFWWSPDSNKLAYLKFDDTEVPMFPLYKADGLHGELEETRYPKVGDTNPGVQLGVIDLNSKQTVWLDNNDSEDKYIAFPDWSLDSEKLIYQSLNRDQNNLTIYLADIKTGEKSNVYHEAQKTWIDFFNDIYMLPNSQGFILRSDKSDWRNLYHYNFNGELVNQITDLDFRVNRMLKYDDTSKKVYFSGTGEQSIEAHLYSVNLDGSKLKKLTKESGSNTAKLSPSGKYFINTHSDINTTPSVSLLASNGKLIRTLGKSKEAKKGNSYASVELLTITTPDGFEMPVKITYPQNFDPNQKYGVVFQIYGGPNAKGIRNSYRDPNRSYMAQNGIIQFSVDHRGSGQFGKKGLNYLHRNLGKWEIEDYITAVKWLKSQKYIDHSKIGITGGSYGGYMTALALTMGADYFTHGIAGSAVTNFRLYDNVYTERYMDTYKDNKDGYDFGSAMTHAAKLKGSLRIVHGTMDDNVHMQHIIQLVDELQEQGKDFELMLYPNGRHGWGGNKRKHSTRLAKEYWLKHFGKENVVLIKE